MSQETESLLEEKKQGAPQSQPKKSSFWSLDVRHLPVFRRWFWTWRTLVLANTQTRREAKAIMFGELAEAARQRMPLDVALALNSLSLKETGAVSGANPILGPGTRHGWLQSFVALFMLLFSQLGYLFYIMLSFRYRDVERVARLLAIRLHEHVAKGIPLSQAMERCEYDYDAREVAIVKAAEEQGNVAAALASLAHFQVTEKRLSLQGAQTMYPLVLGYVLMVPVAFCMVVIVPKFKDIFDQLGGSLPDVTLRLIDFFSPTGWMMGLLVCSATALMIFFIVRALMNGNYMSRFLLAFAFAAFGEAAATIVLPLAFWGVERVWGLPVVINYDSYHESMGPVEWLAVVLVGLGIALAVLPSLLKQIELTVLHIERTSEPLIRRLPFVGAAAQAQAESRWLGAVHAGLASGVSAGDSLRLAGRICGGGIGRRSQAAAQKADQGLSVGHACLECSVLSSKTNHCLVLLDANPDYLAGLRSVSEDASQQAFEVLYRTGRICEILGVVLLGVVMSFFVFALYMPLFNIPQIVMSASR